MAGKLPMGTKELMRAKIMEMVKQGNITLVEASVKLRISYRQGKRIYARYKSEGDAGLIHRNQGRPSNNQKEENLRELAIQAYNDNYPDFGPTFAAEKLAEREGLIVDHETLRRWLLAENLWKRKRRSNQFRSRRDRKERFGELVQFDGSHHDWFEGRREKCCLMNMVDDATGKTLGFLSEQETTVSAMELLWLWIRTYGIPQAVYCDRKNAFVLDREPTIEEQLNGIDPRSPFELACDKLGIEVIVARSPQAKGRVERNHAVYQDRFVKELRLRDISTIEEANFYLAQEYLPGINKKLARLPKETEDAHAPLLSNPDLRDIFCFEHRRVVSKDFVIQFEKHLFQIDRDSLPRPRPGDKVTVKKWIDDSIHIYWNKKPLLVQEILTPQKKECHPLISA
ncbi:MAG: ISNCY family transposase [Nitrospirales bacterium]|nr:MAG: ISNCY family transposase [Nitrospirales bacterium]